MHAEPVTPLQQFVHRLNHLRAITRTFIGIALAIVVCLALLPVHMALLTRVMLGWDVYSQAIILMAALTFFTMKPPQIRLFARAQDASRVIVFLIVLLACITSLVAILDLLSAKGGWRTGRGLETFIYIFGVISSWLLMHTMYTLRYAHTYYGDHPNNPNQQAGGLTIPGDEAPDYLDFAYFAFVIGMTFQVSDINITSKHLRRMALMHGLLSFLFNTVIVALTVNEIVNLRS